MRPNVLDEALELAAQGIRVFPCNICKTPATPHGFHDASTDADEVRRLWHRHFGPLIGVPTGITFDVLDLDFPRHPESRIWWRENRHRVPRTRVHQTGSGGWHLLFQPHNLVRCSAGKMCIGVDSRAGGGYIIWWPAYGLPVLSSAPLAPWADWLLAEFRPKLRPQSSSIVRVPDNRLIIKLRPVLVRVSVML